MQENANDKPSSQPTPESANPNEVDKGLASLKTEISLLLPDLIELLESGTQFILVSDSQLRQRLDPDWLRLIGGMTILCCHYGASVLFVNAEKVLIAGDRI